MEDQLSRQEGLIKFKFFPSLSILGKRPISFLLDNQNLMKKEKLKSEASDFPAERSCESKFHDHLCKTLFPEPIWICG